MSIDFEKVLKEKLHEDAFAFITSSEKEFADWVERVRWQAKRCDELFRELKQFKDKREQGLLLELPVAVGSTVYVIAMCGNVNTIMDGDFETATGYYCPFELKSQCPHDCEDCEDVKNELAVFEDTISYIGYDETGIHLFTEDTGICCTIGKDAFFNREEAEAALEKMKKEG